MADRNWRLITSGATFEALALTLVRFEDPKAVLFGRRGPDGGQDARSGDGTRVFQAKYHEDRSSAKAIADAKREAEKLVQYRKLGHPRYGEWTGVRYWRLVANVEFNPADRQRWDKEVVPLFLAQGLDPDYWGERELGALLDKHPEVDRSFFRNETRAFLSLPEFRERLPGDEPFLSRAALGGFFGRTKETDYVRAFLSSNSLFLVIHGAGGIGKTRLLLEAGEQIASEGSWQVLCANVASMESTAAWFDAIVPEQPTLLLVDEPADEQLLRVLAEQLESRVGRTMKWKVAVAVRSPKDPILRFLRAPRMANRVQELQLGALSTLATEEMCSDLFAAGPLVEGSEAWRQEAAHELARRFSGHPVWLTLAVHLLESHGDLAKLPASSEGLASSYIDEILSLQRDAPAPQIQELLRWVALIGTVNREDDAAVRLLADGSGIEGLNAVRRHLAALVERRALVERGAQDRFVEVKPDVVRDYVLRSWLSVDVGHGETPIQPSEGAKILVDGARTAVLSGKITSLGRAILTSLGRTELLLKLSGTPVPLLAPFFSGLSGGLAAASASQRVVIAEILLDVAVFHPSDTVALSRTLRSSDVSTETVEGLFRNTIVGKDDVILKLAWSLYHAAMGAQTESERQQVLEELCAITEAEADLASRLPRGLPNDGKRAAGLMRRALEGGPQFWGAFDDAAVVMAGRLLDRVVSMPPTSALEATIKALLEPAMSIERRQSWSEDYTFHFQTYLALPGHPAWKAREWIVDRVKALASDNMVPAATRLMLWRLLAEAHRSASQARGRGPESIQTLMRQVLLDDLNWVCSILTTRSCDLEELAAARALWIWHRRFEKDPELKAVSAELEAIYSRNDLAREFEPLLSREDWEQKGQRAAEKAIELAASRSPAIVEAFIDRATRFLGQERDLQQLGAVAWELGRNARTSQVVRTFVKDCLKSPVVSPRTDLATTVAASWVGTLRASGPSHGASELIVDLLGQCGSDQQRIALIRRLYGAFPNSAGELTTAECKLVRSLRPMFMENRQGSAFIVAVAWTLHHDWPSFKLVVEQVLDGTRSDQLDSALDALVDAVYLALHGRDPETIPADLGTWLLEQLIRLPDLGGLGGNLDWHLQEIFKVARRPPISWLPRALARRGELEAADGQGKFRALSYQAPLGRYVNPISLAQVHEPEVARAVASLVDLVSDQGTVGYQLHELLREVDPEGLMVPTEITHRLAAATESDEAWRLARIGGGYSIGSEPWRTIARPVLSRAASRGGEERGSLFSALTEHGPRAWSGALGEVPPIFVSEVRLAMHRLESETEPQFRSFWEWCLERAKEELREQEQHAKEERGE